MCSPFLNVFIHVNRTGFSYVNPDCSWCDYVHNQTAVNEHMYSALQSILRIFPFLQHRDIVLTGESYAGHYIPSLADYIMVVNKDLLQDGNFKLPLAAIAIGNGWSIPRVQYNYGDFAYNIGIVSSAAAAQLTRQYERCKVQERKKDYSGQGECNILGEILAASGPCPAEREIQADDDGAPAKEKPANSSKNDCYGPIVNYFDTRLYYDADMDWPAGNAITTVYLNKKEFKESVHAKRKETYQMCSADAGKYLAILDGLGVQSEIIRLLEQNIPITFYSGQYDLICNHIGNGAMLQQLQWSGAEGFKVAHEYVWTTPQLSNSGKKTRQIPTGYIRQTDDRRLVFIVVIGASHMVPYNVPKESLDLIHRVIKNISFGDYRQDATWTFSGDTAEAEIKAEIEGKAEKVFNFFFKGPYSFDYIFISLCFIFICTVICLSRGFCGGRFVQTRYVRIPDSR